MMPIKIKYPAKLDDIIAGGAGGGLGIKPPPMLLLLLFGDIGVGGVYVLFVKLYVFPFVPNSENDAPIAKLLQINPA